MSDVTERAGAETAVRMAGSTADGTVVVRHCTCTYAWGTGTLGNVTEVRLPAILCPTHRAGASTPEGSRP